MRYHENQIRKVKKLDQPVLWTGIMDTVAGTAPDMFEHHRLPWMGKKAFDVGRYYGSEALRDKKTTLKAIDFSLGKSNPMIQNVGSQALDSLSTKIRPKKNYKTNRKDLDGAGLLDGLLINEDITMLDFLHVICTDII